MDETQEQQTVDLGQAARITDRIVGQIGHFRHVNPATVVFGYATALVVIPIAISAAAEAGVSAKPMLMAVAAASAAAFMTPVATPANLMVMGPGAYRFGDYWRLGLRLLIVFGLVAVLLVPVFWSF